MCAHIENIKLNLDLTFPSRLSLSEGVRLGRVCSRPSPERCERSDQREVAERVTASDAHPLAENAYKKIPSSQETGRGEKDV